MGQTEAPARESEADFQARIVKAAKAAGWLVYHTHDSRRCEAGYPDLTLCRGPVALFAEVKANNGVLKLAQVRWLYALNGAGCQTRIWTPDVADLIERDLGLTPGTLTDTTPNRFAKPATTSAEATRIAQEAREAGYGTHAAQRIADAVAKGR